MKIGLFGGTFDPIHLGHLIIARDAVEALGLDQLHFVPNSISPHKLGTSPTPPQLRAEMIRAAIAGEPHFSLYEGELERPGASFAIDTVLDFCHRHPRAELFYLLGQDNLADLHTWRRIDELLELATFVVQMRGTDARGASETGAPTGPTTAGPTPRFLSDASPLTPYQRASLRLLPQRQIDISATEIRMRVAKRQPIRYFVPESVHDLITRHHLYSES